MADYEPFLINPPKRKSMKHFSLRDSLKRRILRFSKNAETGETDYADGGIELTEPSERDIMQSIKKTKMYHKRALKAGRTRRKHMARKKKAKKKLVTRKRKVSTKQLAALARGRAIRLRHLKKKAHSKVKARRRVTTIKRVVVGSKSRTRVATIGGYKRKGFRKTHKRHIVAAYKLAGGRLFTSPFARTVKPLVRLNPFSRRYSNPFGEELMMVGANPRRRHTMAKRRQRGNPITNIRSLLPMIAGGTVGALATRIVPNMLNLTNAWTLYAAQAAIVLGGGLVTGKFVGKAVSDGWVVGGAAYMLSNIVSGVVGGALAGLGVDAFPDTYAYGAFPDQVAYGNVDEFAPTAVY